MNRSKFILGDIGAIRKYGLKSYIDNYFWPVSESKYQQSASKMHEKYVDIIENIENPVLYEIALVELTFIVELQHIYHYQLVKQYATKNKYSLCYTDSSSDYYEPNWEKYSSYYYEKKFPYGKIIRIIRRIIKTFILNKHLGFIQFIKGLLMYKSVISVGSYDRLKKEYVEKKSLFCHHYDWPDIFKKNSEFKYDVNLQTIEIHKQVIIPYLEFLSTLDPLIFSKEFVDKIRVSWKKRLKGLIYLFHNCTIFSANQIVLITEAGKPHSKIISLVNNRHNVKSYCFHHGSDMGEVVQEISHTRDTSQCRYFIVPSSGAKTAYMKNYGDITIEKRIGTNYISNESNFYKELYSTNLQKQTNSDIKNIMIIGYPMTPYRPSEEVGIFFYIRLEFEYRLIIELKNQGYNVLYKAHPDRLDEITGLFEGIVDEFLVESFEQVWEKADALIYGLTSTSTFGYGLCTNLPITLIDIDGTLWNKKQKQYLNDRISFVPAKLNRDQKIEFSSDTLINSFRNPKSSIEWSGIDLYFG